MSFTEAIRQCFSKYATFSGRAIRSEYWWFILFYVIASLILSLIETMVFEVDPATQQVPPYFSGLFSLLMLIPLLSVAWRRLQDTGRPGYYALLPMALSLITVVAMFTGVLTFAHIANGSANPEALRGIAAWFGFSGLVLAGVLQLALAILMLYWMTRPSDPLPNAYGPPAQAFIPASD